MNTIEAVLFDLDGTLLDTAPDFFHVVNRILAEENQVPVSYELVRNTVSNGARALITAAFKLHEGDSEFSNHVEKLLSYYSQHLAVKTCLFPDMDNFLQALERRDIAWGIVTNKPSQYTNAILTQLNLQRRCGVAICPDQVINKKPHPEPIFKACELLGVNPHNTFYIGDHARDIASGRAAGSQTIAALWGYISAEENTRNWSADYYLDQPRDLITLFETRWQFSTKIAK